MVFARKTDDTLASLGKQLDKTIAANESSKMAGFVVLLTEDPDAAESEVRRLATLFPDTFFGPIRIETPQERGSGKLFRLLSVPMTGEEARGVCDQLKKRRQDCLIINR